MEAVSAQFLEVLIAPSYSADALAAIAKKANVRVLAIAGAPRCNAWDSKRVGGGMLVQTADVDTIDAAIAQGRHSRRTDTGAGRRPAVCLARRKVRQIERDRLLRRGAHTLGIGAGQMSRVDSTRIAAIKAANAGIVAGGVGRTLPMRLSVPRRTLDVVADNGAVAVIQPGGGVRDTEVIAAAGRARRCQSAFTGVRHFRH